MENFYDTLGVSPSSSRDEIKQAFLRLALQHHPDKQLRSDSIDGSTNIDDTAKFQPISRAWTVLSDAELRKEYDSAWHQRCVIQQSAGPIQDTVSIDDFETDNEEPDTLFRYPCRCSDYFCITEQDKLFKVDFVCCPSCSLCIKIEHA